MMNKKILISMAMLILLQGLTFAKTESEQEKAEGKFVTNTAATNTEAHSYVEIEFSEGSSSLSEGAKESLRKVLRQASRAGKIDEVVLLSWGDQDYPSKKQKKLSTTQNELADKRNDAIEDYMGSLKKVEFDSYNMTEKPNTLSKWFNTDDNKIKSAFLAAGLPTTSDSPLYASKASHSVVLVKIE